MNKFNFTKKEFYSFMLKHNLTFKDTCKAFSVTDISAVGKWLNNPKSRAKTIQLRKLREQEKIQPTFLDKLF